MGVAQRMTSNTIVIFGYKTGFSSQNTPKNLDHSYKNLDFGGMFENGMSLPNQYKKSRSVLKDGSRFWGLF